MVMKFLVSLIVGLTSAQAFAMNLNVSCVTGTRDQKDGQVLFSANDFKTVSPKLKYAKRILLNGDELTVIRSDEGNQSSVKIYLIIPQLQGLMVEGGGINTIAIANVQNASYARYTVCTLRK